MFFLKKQQTVTNDKKVFEEKYYHYKVAIHMLDGTIFYRTTHSKMSGEVAAADSIFRENTITFEKADNGRFYSSKQIAYIEVLEEIK